LTEQSERRIKLLYIAGWGRSGTTILDNILGQLKGFTSVGELRWVWERGLIENRRCGCGEQFQDCPYWKQVLHWAYDVLDQVDATEMMQACHRTSGNRNIPAMLLRRGRGVHEAGSNRYFEALTRLYAAVRDVTDSRVIVDSSKDPVYGSIVAQIPFVDLYTLHVVRDPRAVAYSWMTPKLRNDDSGPSYMLTFNPVASSLLWDACNPASESLGSLSPDRYLRIRYEDFVVQPRESVMQILKLLHEDADRLPFLSETTVTLSPIHTFSGNPSRFQTGPVEIKLDSRWRKGLGRSTNALISILTSPLLKRYGYPFIT
jgi:hypothetical protein